MGLRLPLPPFRLPRGARLPWAWTIALAAACTQAPAAAQAPAAEPAASMPAAAASGPASGASAPSAPAPSAPAPSAPAPSASAPSASAPSAPSAPPAPAAPAPTASAPAPVAEGATPALAWRLLINAPPELRELLQQHLALARFLRAETIERITRPELNRLIAATPAQARALAETLGYFASEVRAHTGSTGANDPVLVLVDVTPGPRTQVQDVQVEFEGPLSVAAEAGEREAAALVAQVRRDWELKPGLPFTQPAWGNAKNAALNALRAQGYLSAALSGSTAQVDAPSARVRLYLVVDSGPRFHFGELRIEGLVKVEPEVIHNLTPFGPGARYREQLLMDFQDRLVKTNLFDSVTVTVEPDPALAAALPVQVRLRERAENLLTLGVGVSDLAGPRVTVEHLRQNLFGFAWQAKSKLELGRTLRSAQVDLTSHPKSDLWRNLLSGAVSHSETADLIVNSQRTRLGRAQDSEHIDRLYYVEWQRAVNRPDQAGLKDEASSITANYEWTWRNLDNPILPTRGLSATVETGVGYSFQTSSTNADAEDGRFVRTRARITLYWPLFDVWYAQARAEAGEVFAGENVLVPITLLFRAGGDESVRGYAYQSLGPQENGRPAGGKVLASGSIELARPFSRDSPAWWGAVFADAGDAKERWEDFDAALGYGFGVRWRSPVGPLRVDLARGVDVGKWRLHFNVGVVF